MYLCDALKGSLGLCALLLAACSGIPSSQEGRLADPTVKPKLLAKAVVVEAEPAQAGPVDVYILPLDDFPIATARAFARRLSQELSLNVRAAAPVETAKLAPTSSGQFAAEDIMTTVIPTTDTLPDRHAKTIYLLYTRRDINDREAKSRYLFAHSNIDRRMSVISTHRMYWDYRWVTPSADLNSRLWKMSKRAVGEHYYGLPRTGDIQDIMYSPLLSPEDIDRIGNEFRGLPAPSVK